MEKLNENLKECEVGINPIATKDEVVNYVYCTYDYDKFKIMEKGNRDIDHDGRIAKSMKKNFLFSPILVNEKMEIIDGQNRFIASKSLGYPIYYIVMRGYGLNEVRILNTNSVNWKTRDYIKSYADEDKIEYIKLENLIKSYPDIPASIILRIIGNNAWDNNRILRNGIIKVKNVDYTEHILKMLMTYKPLHKDIFRRREFASAIIRLDKDPQFNNDKVVERIKKYPRSFVPCVSAEDYVRMIEEIVNYKRRIKIRFNV